MKALTGIAAAEFARRRRQLMRMAGEDAILVLPAAPERVRSHDTHYPYRQDSDFWYLSGFPEIRQFQTDIPNARRASIQVLFTKDAERGGFPYQLKSSVISKKTGVSVRFASMDSNCRPSAYC